MSLPQPLSAATTSPHATALDLPAAQSAPAPDQGLPEGAGSFTGVPGPAEAAATSAVRAGIDRDPQHGAVMPPLVLSSNFSFRGLGEQRRYDYTRSGNPTRDLLGDTLADLEGGARGVITSSGMSAIHLVLHLLPPGSRVVAAHDCYGGTHRLLSAYSRRRQLEVRFADLSRAESREEATLRGADLVWIETPSNPLLRLTDIAAVCAAARKAGARVAVDNTCLSPALQRPIEHGADLVVHSTTKYLNGHSDVVGGAVIAADSSLGDDLTWWANCLGLAGAPFDSFLTQRGLRSLHARLRVHEENAAEIARVLIEHPAVDRVYYPGLLDHPGHDLAVRQQDGFGAIVSFELRGGEAAVRELVARTRLFTLAESLGGVESLVAHPATMTHAAMEPEARRAAGLGDGLLRLSVGLESARDLAHDLRSALDQAEAAGAAQRLETGGAPCGS
ncbi:MAG: cystathionine gamma-synthase [Acidobacteriota bacterium]